MVISTKVGNLYFNTFYHRQLALRKPGSHFSLSHGMIADHGCEIGNRECQRFRRIIIPHQIAIRTPRIMPLCVGHGKLAPQAAISIRIPYQDFSFFKINGIYLLGTATGQSFNHHVKNTILVSCELHFTLSFQLIGILLAEFRQFHLGCKLVLSKKIGNLGRSSRSQWRNHP